MASTVAALGSATGFGILSSPDSGYVSHTTELSRTSFPAFSYIYFPGHLES